MLIRYPNGNVKAISYTNVKLKESRPGWRYKIGISLQIIFENMGVDVIT